MGLNHDENWFVEFLKSKNCLYANKSNILS